MGGGGFENTESRPQTGESTASPSRSTTLTPVTIKEVLESRQEVQDGPYVVHSQELHHICFVGVVRNIVDHTANIVVTVEDGTGQIDVRKWSQDAKDLATSQDDNMNKNYNSQLAQQYHIGTYVKVFGALKDFTGKKNIQYAVIKPIESFNDVLAHHLEVIKCFAIATGKFQQVQGTKPIENGAQSLFVQDTGSSDDIAGTVLKFCREQCQGKDANSFAVPIQLIAQTLNISEATAKDCCTKLTEQGYIYPTLTEDLYFAI